MRIYMDGWKAIVTHMMGPTSDRHRLREYFPLSLSPGVQLALPGDRAARQVGGGGEHRPPRRGRHQHAQPGRAEAGDPGGHRTQLQAGTQAHA